MSILNCVVCYNNENEIVEYAKKLKKQTDSENIRFIVTINKSIWSEEQFFNTLKEVKIHSFIYNPGENLGYLNGMLFGYQKYLESNEEDFEWVIFSCFEIFSADFSGDYDTPQIIKTADNTSGFHFFIPFFLW